MRFCVASDSGHCAFSLKVSLLSCLQNHGQGKDWGMEGYAQVVGVRPILVGLRGNDMGLAMAQGLRPKELVLLRCKEGRCMSDEEDGAPVHVAGKDVWWWYHPRCPRWSPAYCRSSWSPTRVDWSCQLSVARPTAGVRRRRTADCSK